MTSTIQRTNVQAQPEQPQELSFLEKIIDKKVNGVALSCFEAIVDWFLTTFSCCYPGYSKLYEEKRVNIIHFAGTYIEDRTAKKIVTVTEDDRRNQALLQGMTRVPHRHYITLNNHKVIFSGIPGRAVLYGAQYFTDHLVITDRVDHPGQVLIKEYETTGAIKDNIVDTNKQFKRNSIFGALPLQEPELVYVCEQGCREINPRDQYLQPA